jgi:hypothetical protein
MARRENKGAAVSTTLSAGIDAAVTAFNIDSSSGWPTGGANGNFFATLDPDTPNEERVLVGAQAGGACTSVLRGQDNNTAKTHATGAVVIHSSAAVDYDEANRHINVTTDDNHTQYMKTDGTRHDLTARHPGGTVVPTAIPVAVGTALAEGGGTNLAKSTHVHVLGAGSINTANMFAAGIVDATAIGAGAVGSSELGTDSVIAGKIADLAIDDENLFIAGLTPIIVSGSNPGAVGAGRVWLNTTAAKYCLMVRNAANTGWDVMTAMVDLGYVPTYPGMFAVGNAVHFARYTRFGPKVIANGYFRIGSTTSFAGLTNLAISTPVAAKDLDAFVGYPGTGTAEFFSHAASRGTTGSGVFAAVGIVPQAGASKALDRMNFFATAGSAAWSQTVPASWAAGDRFSWFVEYEPASLEDPNYV